MKWMELESERLLYRAFRQEDFPIVFDWLGSAENIKYRRGEPRSAAEAHVYLDWAIACAEAEERRTYEFAVVLKSRCLLIGAATLMNVPDDPEIGWTLHREHWRQGYGSEMGKTLLKFGFETLGLRRIIAGCNAENTGSYRIMEKIGMRREARFVRAQRGGGALGHRWCDRLQYAMLAEEYGRVERA